MSHLVSYKYRKNCFLLFDIDNQISEMPINTNYYYRLINEYFGKDFALEVSDKNGNYVISMAPLANNVGQYWQLIRLRKNVYSLRTRLLNDSYSVEIIDDKTYTNLHMAPTRNDIGQQWYLFPINNQTFRLTNELTGNNKYLNVYSNTKTVFMDSNADHYNQYYWNLIKITEVLHN